MIRRFSFLFAALIVTGVAAQSGQAQSNAVPGAAFAAQPQNSNQVPSGTIITAELSKSLDAKKAKVGDKIEGKLPVDVLAHGKILIPRNSKVIGRVTDVKAHSKESPDSRVAVAFDRLVLKNGREVPLQIVLQAVGRPLMKVSLNNPSFSEGAANVPSSNLPGSAGGYPGRAPASAAPEPDSPNAPDSVAPLGPTSKGAIGMKGVSLEASKEATMISSKTENVHLDGGAQLILRAE